VSTKLEYDDDDESVRVAKDLKDSPSSLERENEMMMDAILSDSLIRNTELQRTGRHNQFRYFLFFYIARTNPTG
jgi:hypothetical protein